MNKSNTYYNLNSALRFAGILLVLILAGSFTGCKETKSVAGGSVVTIQEAPEWVNSRPHNSANYIGVGSASKITQPLDYQAIAKKNALNDLASEISVRVQGSTFLNSMEVNKTFSEEFISTINTTTDEKLEDYEVAGIWENQKEYWVYYRLNKSLYQQKKAEKKNQAMAVAYDLYSKGLSSEQSGQIVAALDQYMRGLFALKDYWAEVNEYTTAEKKIFLDQEIYDRMKRVTSELTIKPAAQKVVLSAENSYRSDLRVKLEYQGKPVKGVSLMYSYQKSRFMKPRTGETDDAGEIIATIEDVSLSEKNNVVDFKINTDQFIAQDLDLRIQQGLIKSLRTENKTLPIELITPSFKIFSEEKSFGQPGPNTVLASAFSAALVKEGMKVIQGTGEANYKVNITSNTTSGGQAQGFSVAFLEMTITVSNAVTGETIYKESPPSIKGLQLNNDAAGIEAYKKGKEKIEQEIIKSLLTSIL